MGANVLCSRRDLKPQSNPRVSKYTQNSLIIASRVAPNPSVVQPVLNEMNRATFLDWITLAGTDHFAILDGTGGGGKGGFW